jgi:hypothetical protein
MDKLAELIASATERLGLEATRIWPQMVLLTWVKAVTELVLTVAVMLVAALVARQAWGSYYRLRRAVPNPTAGTIDDDAQGFATIRFFLGASACGVALITMCFSLSDWIGAIVAPEAMTVMRLIGK